MSLAQEISLAHIFYRNRSDPERDGPHNMNHRSGLLMFLLNFSVAQVPSSSCLIETYTFAILHGRSFERMKGFSH